jgi:hypothetical protein
MRFTMSTLIVTAALSVGLPTVVTLPVMAASVEDTTDSAAGDVASGANGQPASRDGFSFVDCTGGCDDRGSDAATAPIAATPEAAAANAAPTAPATGEVLFSLYGTGNAWALATANSASQSRHKD